MTAPRETLAEIGDQRPRHDEGHGCSDNNPPLWSNPFLGCLKVDEADDANEFVSDLDLDAFNEVARDDNGFGHVRRTVFFSHHGSFDVVGIMT